MKKQYLIFAVAAFAVIICAVFPLAVTMLGPALLIGAAVTDNQRRKISCSTHRKAVPLAAAVRAYGYTLLYLNAAGFGVVAPVTNYRFAGLVVEEADNTAGVAGALSAEVIEDGKALLLFSGTTLTQAHNGSVVFGVDNNTVTIDSGAGKAIVGNITEFVSGTTAWVALNPYENTVVPS